MNNLTLDDLYLRYVRDGNPNSGDYAAALNWGMSYWVSQGSKQPLVVTLENRVYNCAQTISAVDGGCLVLLGSGGFMTGPTQTGLVGFSTVTRFDGPTLSFPSGVSTGDAYLRVRSDVDSTQGDRPGSSLWIEGIAVRGQTDWQTTVYQTIGLEASGPLTIRNCHFSNIPLDGLVANPTKTTITNPGPIPAFYGEAKDLVIDQLLIENVGRNGWFAGANAEGCSVHKLFVDNWGTNTNHSTGTAALGTSNATAIRDDGAAINFYSSCKVGSTSNGHWKYMVTNIASSTTLISCMQSGAGGSSVLFSNVCLGGNLSHTTPDVTIGAGTPFPGDSHGQIARVNTLHGQQLFRGIQYDPTNENLAMGSRDFRLTGLSLNNKNIIIDSSDGGEYEFAARREDIPAHGDLVPGNNPTFGLMRVYTAGIGQPAYRVVYRDDRGGERTIWSGESTGTHAPVGDGSGKPYLEWYYEDGEVVPLGRIMGRGTGVGIERFQYQHLELGAGDGSEVDVFLGRSGAGEGFLGWTADVSLGINPEAKWRQGVLEATNSLATPKVDCSTQIIQQGVRDTYFDVVSIAESPYTVGAKELVLCNAVGGSTTCNLPDASLVYGRNFTFAKTDSSANTTTINAFSGQFIDGYGSRHLEHYAHRISMVSTGGGWVVLGESRRKRYGAMSASGVTISAVGTPGKSAATAGWASSGELRGFSYSNGVLTKSSGINALHRIGWSFSGSASGVTVTRASFAKNGSPVFAASNQIETFSGYPPRAMSGEFHVVLAWGDTIEFWLECFSGTPNVTLDFATVTIEEISDV